MREEKKTNTKWNVFKFQVHCDRFSLTLNQFLSVDPIYPDAIRVNGTNSAVPPVVSVWRNFHSSINRINLIISIIAVLAQSGKKIERTIFGISDSFSCIKIAFLQVFFGWSKNRPCKNACSNKPISSKNDKWHSKRFWIRWVLDLLFSLFKSDKFH